MMKKCSRCKEIKDGNEFGKRASSKDGLDSRCLKCIRECSKQSEDKNRDKNKNGITVSNKLCPTCRVEKSAECFGTNPSSKDGLRNECKDCRNAKTRFKYETDSDFRENESVRAAVNYQKDRVYILERGKKWAQENPDKKIESVHRRIARLYGQVEFDLPKDFIKILIEKQNHHCIYCARDNVQLTVEHMLPLSRGGKHCFSNIVLACTTCNFSKNNKTLEEWLKHNQKLQQIGVVSELLNVICDNLENLLETK